MISQLDTNQQFIFDQIKFGLANKPSPEPLTDIDIERLSWPADAYSKIPTQEWNEWSRKIHWALQYSFSRDTSRLENKERLEVWRKKCMAVVQSALAKGDKRQSILESSAFHFVQQDLLHHLVDVYGFKNLTDEEQEMVSILSGASKHTIEKDQIFLNALSRYRRFGYIMFFLAFAFAIAGLILWRWYAIPIAVILGFAISQIFSNRFYSNLSKRTGYDKSTLRYKMMETDDKNKGLS